MVQEAIRLATARKKKSRERAKEIGEAFRGHLLLKGSEDHHLKSICERVSLIARSLGGREKVDPNTGNLQGSVTGVRRFIQLRITQAGGRD